MSKRLIAKDGKVESVCNHDFIFLGTHPSFAGRYVCFDCKQYVEDIDLRKYSGLMAFVRTERIRDREGRPYSDTAGQEETARHT